MAKALLPSIPCSRITRLMMDRTDPKMRFTLPSDRPLPNRWSRKAAASDDEYEVIGLLPNAYATYLPLRFAARMKVGVCFSAFSLR